MPKIPIYQQQVTPNAGGIAPNARDSYAGRGLAAIGAGLERVAGAVDRSEEVDFLIQKDRIETEGRIYASRSTSQIDLDMAGHLQESQKAAPPGAPGFTPSFLKGFDEYTKKAVSNAPSQFARQLIQAHVQRSREAYGKAAMMYEDGEHKRYLGQQIDEGVNMSATLVSGNAAWFDREMGKWLSTIDAASVAPDAKAKMRDLARTTLVGAAVKSAIDRNPQAALGLLEAWQKEPDGSVELDGVKVPIGLADFKQQQALIEYARKKSEGLRQEASVSLRYDTQNLEAMAQAGVAPTGPVRTQADFSAAYKNPEVAAHEWARYQSAYDAAVATAGMQGETTADLLQVIQNKPKAGDPNFAVSARAQGVQARAAAGIIQQRQADPVAYAMTAGDFGLQPLNPQDPAKFSEELKRRTAALPVMVEKYGAASMLAKTEATQLARGLDVMPADQKVAQLENIRRSVGDDLVYGSLLNSIRPDSPVTALVGNVAAVGASDAARMIARGEDLLNPTKDGKKTDGKGSFPMPKETDLRAKWVEYVGDAYRGYPDAEATAYQAFKAYYAAAASDKGLNDPAAGVNENIAKAATKAATGGVTKWRTDWFGNDTPSASIVLPYGMAEDQFKDRVTAEWLRVRAAAGYPKTEVGDVGLYNTGANGEYMVMSGTSWLPGKDGKPVILRLNGPTHGRAATGQIGGR